MDYPCSALVIVDLSFLPPTSEEKLLAILSHLQHGCDTEVTGRSSYRDGVGL